MIYHSLRIVARGLRGIFTRSLYICLPFFFLIFSLCAQEYDQKIARYLEGHFDLTALEHNENIRALSQKITVNLEDISLDESLKFLDDQSPLKFAYSRDVIPMHKRINLHLNQISLLEVLHAVLAEENVNLIISSGGQLVFVPSSSTFVPLQDPIVQEPGRITGKVIDVRTNHALPGANIIIVGTTIGAATDGQGFYTLRRIHEGTYTVRAQYMGYKTDEQTITLSPGEIVTLNFSMESRIIELHDDIIVVGVVEGQARALMEQRRSPTTRNIISSELMEQFGDYSLEGSISRLPGVQLEYYSGEPYATRIRGAYFGNNTVTLNGIPLPANSGDHGGGHRGTQLTSISADAIDGLELITGLTPDMSAHNLTGGINLRLNPISPRRSFRLNIGTDYDNFSSKYDPRVSVRYGQRIFNNQVGLRLQGDWRRTNRLGDFAGYRWDLQDFGQGPEYTLIQYSPARELVKRNRYGFSTQMDYRFSDESWIYVMGLFNRQYDNDERLWDTADLSRGTYIDRNSVTNYRYDRTDRFRPDNIRDLYQVQLGGELSLLDRLMNIDYALSYGHGSWQSKGTHFFSWRNNRSGLSIFNVVDYKNPIIHSPDNAGDVSDFGLRYYEWDDSKVTDDNWIGDVNIKIPYSVANYQGEWKIGARYHRRDNDAYQPSNRYEYNESLTMDQFIGDWAGYTPDHNTHWIYGPRLDLDKFVNFFENNRGNFSLDFDRYREGFADYYSTLEEIYATYIMTTVNIANWTLLGGVRMEYYSALAESWEIIYDDDGNWVENIPASAKPDYVDFFPSIHATYAISPLSVLRMSWTNSIGRPNFSNTGISSSTIVRPDNQYLRTGNPNVQPERSSKYEFSLEHYLESVGIISGGLYLLDMRDVIVDQIEIVEGGEYDGWERRTVDNAQRALSYGVHFSWQQQLYFLPGYLKRLAVYANYTYTNSEMAIDVPMLRVISREDLVPHRVNFALAYDIGSFYCQVSMTYASKYFATTNARTIAGNYFDRYEETYQGIDVSAIYRITRYIRLSLEMKNLLNKPYRDRYLSPVQDIDVPRLYESIRSNGWNGALSLRVDI
jgi:TonB-dependent receptor